MAASTIGTMEDLLRVLDENPEWLEALRTRLLTRELLELPQRFAEFAAETRQQFAEHGKILAEHGKILAEHTKMLAEHTKMFAEHRAMLAEHDKRLDRLVEQVSALTATTASLESEMKAMRIGMGQIKGAHARNVAVEGAGFLAQDMGLRLTRVLSTEDIVALMLAGDLGDTPTNVLRSFRKADIVMEAVDESGADCCVAVEVSYTADGRDTTRAVRNAGMLARLTGKPTRAAVAGFHMDNNIRGILESGEVFWHQLDLESEDIPAE